MRRSLTLSLTAVAAALMIFPMTASAEPWPEEVRLPGGNTVRLPDAPTIRDPQDYEVLPIHLCVRNTIVDDIHRVPCVSITR